MIKDILASTDATDTGRARLRFAVDVAHLLGADLTAFYTTPTATDAGVPLDVLAESCEEGFRALLQQCGLRGDFLLGDAPRTAEFLRYVRYADLAILGLGDPDRTLADPQGIDVAEVLTAAGRPVLGVPIGPLPKSFPARAVVAWDASRGATRALHDSLPLLRIAESVTVVTVGTAGPGPACRLEPVIAHLAKHGIAAGADKRMGPLSSIGSDLLDRVEGLEAGLLVAGAFGHSRLAERFVGGVSQTLLHQMLVPVILSH
jgi:nucleotide-binding universal stress UspA family protein